MRKDSEKRETYHILNDVVCLLQVKPFFFVSLWFVTQLASRNI